MSCPKTHSLYMKYDINLGLSETEQCCVSGLLHSLCSRSGTPSRESAAMEKVIFLKLYMYI